MKKLLPIVLVALAFTAIAISCEKTPHDPEGRDTDFTVPTLTEDNTIRFTVDAYAGRRVEIVLEGGRIAVDWGDGSPMTKDRDVRLVEGTSDPDMERRVLFRHTYPGAGEYTVQIWSDEVTFFVHQTIDGDLDELHVGNCPALAEAWLYGFTNTSLDLGGCPALENLSLGYCEELETVALEKCTNLQTALIFQNPVLEALDIGGTKGLTEVYCEDNENLASLDLAGCDALEYLYFSGTAVGTFDFSAFPNLVSVSCDYTKLPRVDVSANPHLVHLSCAGLTMFYIDHRPLELDVTGCPELVTLDCGGNNLTALDISGNPVLKNLNVINNRLEKEALEAIFSALPSYYSATRATMRPMPQPPTITIYGNPGVAECDKNIAAGKAWSVKTTIN